ncbi:MAG TPA: vitamin K epoxide reductase family protein [Candidatus Binatia bacterium]|nr:vitamin K epoxide reductase family protein [Candidatus Binatia bacterium]
MANNKRGKQATPAVTNKAPNWPLFALALIGMALSGYLSFTAWQGKQVAFCTEGAGCDVVLNSRWSTLFGMPTSFWGFLTYALLAAVAWNKNAADRWRWAWTISLFGLLFSLYLTSVSLFELKATCPYCLTSLGLMTAIFIVTTLQRPVNLPKFSWGPWLAKTGGAALVGIIALHLYFAGYWGEAQGPEDPWVRALAEHLSRSDVKFYGASWCPHCAEQKQLFDGSVNRIPYVECSPGGPNAPQAEVCKDKNIQSYPTWIIDGQRYTGVQPLDALAQLSHFQYQEEKR